MRIAATITFCSPMCHCPDVYKCSLEKTMHFEIVAATSQIADACYLILAGTSSQYVSPHGVPHQGKALVLYFTFQFKPIVFAFFHGTIQEVLQCLCSFPSRGRQLPAATASCHVQRYMRSSANGLVVAIHQLVNPTPTNIKPIGIAIIPHASRGKRTYSIISTSSCLRL